MGTTGPQQEHIETFAHGNHGVPPSFCCLALGLFGLGIAVVKAKQASGQCSPCTAGSSRKLTITIPIIGCRWGPPAGINHIVHSKPRSGIQRLARLTPTWAACFLLGWSECDSLALPESALAFVSPAASFLSYSAKL